MGDDEKEVVIKISARNLSAPEFERARREVLGLGTAATQTTAGMTGGFGVAQRAAGALNSGLATLATGFTLGGLLERGVMALLDWGRAAIASAGETVDLANQFRVSEEAVQRFSFAADQSGTSVETLLRSAQQLSRRLADGDDSARGAVEALGLSFETLRGLSPDEQFQRVAERLADVEDEGQQTALAMDLFGASGTQALGAINNGLDDLIDKAPVVDAALVGALDNISDEWDAFLARQRSGFSEWAGLWAVLATEGPSATLDAYRRISGEIPPTIRNVTNLLGHQERAARAVGISDQRMAEITRELNEDLKRNQQELEKAAREKERLKQQTEQANAKFRDSVTVFNAADGVLVEYVATVRSAEEASRDLGASLHDLAADASVAEQGFEALKPAIESALGDESEVQVKSFGRTLRENFSQTLQNLPNVILGAVQGGGSVLQAVGTTFGTTLGQSVVTRFGATITARLGETLGGAINTLIPGLGAMLGPLMERIGGFFSRLFGGISPQIREARTAVDEFQASLAATLTTTQQQEAGGERWKQTVIAVRDAYLATGRTAEEAEAIVRQLWDTDHPDRAKAAIEAINRVLAEQKQLIADTAEETRVDFGEMRDIAQRYGVDLASLGPQFHEARLHESANQIYRDFQMLVRGGADVGGVLVGMQDEIQQLVTDSLNFGVAIPENMRPLIEELIRSGQLTDAQGQKLTDVSQIPFAQPLEQSMSRVADKMETVVDKISELIDRLGDIPTSIDIDINGRYNPPELPDGEGYADGTKGVHGDWFGADFGAGRGVVVHGREAIVPFEDRYDFAADVLRASGRAAAPAAAPPISLYVAVDGRGQARAVSEEEYILRTVQDGLVSARLQVPARVIAQRSR